MDSCVTIFILKRHNFDNGNKKVIYQFMSPNSWSESLNIFKWGQLSRTQPFEKFELKSDFTIFSYLSKDGTTRDESGVGGVRQTGLNLLITLLEFYLITLFFSYTEYNMFLK